MESEKLWVRGVFVHQVGKPAALIVAEQVAHGLVIPEATT
jgi:hypothetical protein